MMSGCLGRKCGSDLVVFGHSGEAEDEDSHTCTSAFVTRLDATATHGRLRLGHLKVDFTYIK